MSRFEVGEIAIWIREGSPRFGDEVRIIAPFQIRCLRDRRDGSTREVPTYAIDPPSSWGQPDHGRWLAEPHWLRKRRPRPDWVKLCGLDNIPHEVTCV